MTNLKGKTILFSGVFKGYERVELESAAEKAGAKLLSGVSKNLNYLVAGEKMGSSKHEKALELGVPVIALKDFLKMVGGSDPKKIDPGKTFGSVGKKSGKVKQPETSDDVLKLLTELAKSVKKNKAIKVLECEVPLYFPSDEMIERFKQNYPAFKTLGKNYGLLTTPSLIWKTKSKGDDYLIGDWFAPLLPKSIMVFESEYKKLVLKMDVGFTKKDAFCILEEHPETGDGIFYFIRIPKKGELDIWGFITETTEVYKLSINLQQYIRAMCYFKCMNDWQWLFIRPEFRNKISRQQYARLLERLTILKKLFPEIDINKRDF